jgi:nucleotide-binding universal stress UspA family protein/predicted transcriptional regulator
MAFPYRRILNPVDFDENSINAVKMAAQFAEYNDGTVFLFHVVPMIMPPTPDAMPGYIEAYKGQEDTARVKLEDIARKHLHGVKYELLTHRGDPAGSILRTAMRLAADVIVMATHGRKGFSRVFLGSIAEVVLREAACPVLTVRQPDSDRSHVGHWMTANPVTAAPEEKLSIIEGRMRQGDFRSMAVVDDGRLVGIISDRDLRTHTGRHEALDVKAAMAEPVITVTAETSVQEAARLLHEHKIGALPVVEGGRLIGVISTTDILAAFVSEAGQD